MRTERALPFDGFCRCAWRTLASVQPLALDGLARIIGAWELTVLALGFFLFSAGLVAHVLTPGGGTEGNAIALRAAANRRLTWLGRSLLSGVLLIVILCCMDEIAPRYGSGGRVIPGWLFGLLVPVRVAVAKLWELLHANELAGPLSWDASLWFPLLVIPWLAWRSIVLLLRAGSISIAPLDHVFDSLATRRRFLGYSLSLLALLLAAMPTFALAGLVVLHHTLEAIR